MNNQNFPLGRMPASRCNRCRHWSEDMQVRDPQDENFGFGQCRINPPVILGQIVDRLMEKPSYREQIDPDITTTSAYTATCFPVTFATDRCGQFDENLNGPAA